MNLIAKGKLANYIQQYPKAQVALLTWFKRFKHNEEVFEMDHDIGFRTYETGLDNGEYKLKYSLNHLFKTGYINWFGTYEDFITYNQKSFDARKAINPNLKRVRIEIKAEAKFNLRFPGDDISSITEESVFNTKINPDNSFGTFENKNYDYDKDGEQNIKINFDYQRALTRAIAILNAQPQTDEFNELALLLPLIKHYEDSNIVLPELNPLDAVKLRMRDQKLTRPFLTKIIGSEDLVNLFLSGKETLPPSVLENLYNRLKISFLLNDKDFN